MPLPSAVRPSNSRANTQRLPGVWVRLPHKVGRNDACLSASGSRGERWRTGGKDNPVTSVHAVVWTSAAYSAPGISPTVSGYIIAAIGMISRAGRPACGGSRHIPLAGMRFVSLLPAPW